ncbi:MAG: hypothetical protein NC489_39175 [Ruminococcus flavefaciens]|nr:hypothetical protein [Ruminococcus flavefaciens]
MKNTRKKVLSALLVMAMFVGTQSLSGQFIQSHAAEISSNTKADLLISTTEELNHFASEVRGGNNYAGKTIRLANDIEYDGVTVGNFQTIGISYYSDDGGFSGVFDGAGHTIKGIIATDGLFYGNSGTIKNVVLDQCKFDGRIVGAIVKRNNSYGVIDNCCCKDVTISSTNDAGGIVAYNFGKILNCSNVGTIASKGNFIGGIAASSEGQIYNCCNIGEIQYLSDYPKDCIGGIVGDLYYGGEVQNCYNAGNIINVYDSDRAYFGGIAANVDSRSIVANSVSTEELSLEEMRESSFVQQLNLNRGTNMDWLPWEIRGESAYPLHVKRYAVQFAGISNGVIRSDADYAYAGQKVTVTLLSASSGYQLQAVVVQSGENEIACTKGKGSYEFIMPEGDVWVSAEFLKNTPALSTPIQMPKKVKIKAVKPISGRKLKVSWKKDNNATGYQLQIALDKKFTKSKKSYYTAGASRTIKGLKKGKKYYVRVRAYKLIKGKRKYAAWSGVKRSKKL